MVRATIAVEGMNCQHCVETVTRALQGVAGVSAVEVSLAEKAARVTYDPKTAGAAKLMKAVGEAGFKATGFAKS